MLPEKIRALAVSIGDSAHAGQLLKTSTYEFRYLDPDPEQPAVALLMPPRESLTWQDHISRTFPTYMDLEKQTFRQI